MSTGVDIHTYYNELASTYDEDRFGNSYGKYLHQQEKKFLVKVIRNEGNILDLGCGTGRHLQFATHGLDISDNMISESRKKFPDKILQVASASGTGFEKETFDQVYSFHVLMHLDKQEVNFVFHEVNNILKTRGQFIFDIPSYKRRRLFKYKASGWHGATSMAIEDFKFLEKKGWEIKKIKGVMFFPIHRFPGWIRKLFLPLDNLLCSSPFKQYSSYLMVVLEKK